jgi:hypothetical protein
MTKTKTSARVPRHLMYCLLFCLLTPGTIYAAGTGFWITGMDAVQAVQTPAGGVPLITGKPTFIRVYLRSNEQGHGPWKNVSAKLTVTSGVGVRIHTPISPAKIVAPPNGSDRKRWGDSFTFLLDDDETPPLAHIIVQAEVFSTTGERDGSAPSDHFWGNDYKFSPAMNLSAYAFVWQATALSKDTPSLDAGAWADYASMTYYLNSVFPVSRFTFRPVPSIGTTVVQLKGLTEVRAYANALLVNLPPGSLVNYITPWDTGGLHGYAAGRRSEEQREVTGHRLGVTAAQEIAHTLGLWCHTFDKFGQGNCVRSVYQPFEYPNGDDHIDSADLGIYATYPIRLIAKPGVRVLPGATTANPRVLDYLGSDDVHVVSDIMSYVVPPWTWVSSVTYCELLLAITEKVGVDSTDAWSRQCTPAITRSKVRILNPPPVRNLGISTRRTHLHVNGLIGSNDIATFNMFDQIVTTGLPSTPPGPYEIQLLGRDERVLRRVSFGKGSHHPGSTAGSESFSLLIPFDDIAEATTQILLKRNDKILARRQVPESTPTISLVDVIGGGDVARGVRKVRWRSADASGIPLMHTVEYSGDGGINWMPLAVLVFGNEVDVDFDEVPGSDAAMIRVRASNGVRVAESASTQKFRVARKPAVTSIDTPSAESTMTQGSSLLAVGSAVTLEQGALNNADAFTWSSDLVGVLGHGRWINLGGLNTGTHKVTFEAIGPGELKSSASVVVHVE